MKKYVCKLLFIFLLGHDIDFGHIEAVNLLSSNRYTEKQIGYLFISVMVNARSDLMKLIVQNMKNDLSSSKPVHVNLALHCIANIGSQLDKGAGAALTCGIQGMRRSCRQQIVKNCHFGLHRFAGLQLLFCSRTLAEREVTQAASMLPSAGGASS